MNLMVGVIDHDQRLLFGGHPRKVGLKAPVKGSIVETR
jgi:hypothetical protein